MKINTWLLSLLLAVLANTSAFSATVLTAGYSDANAIAKPFILQRQAANADWTVLQLDRITSPANLDIHPTNFNCNGTNCILLGNESHNPTADLTAIFSSSDSGTTWQYTNVIHDLPTNLNLVFAATTSCHNSMCLLGGATYSNTSNFSNALLARSTDSGKSWENVTLPDAPVNYGAEIKQVKCISDTCVAIGNYQTQLIPLIYVSTNDGQSWQRIKSIDNLPNDYYYSDYLQHLALTTIKHRFILVSGYTNKSDQARSMIITSDDGISWKSNSSIDSLALPDSELNVIHCDQDTCVASGDTALLPITSVLLVSHDEGNSWAQASYPGLDPYDYDQWLTSVAISATHSVWVIAQIMYDKTKQMPSLLESYDAGNTWSRVDLSLLGIKKQTSSELDDINCVDNDCIAVGMESIKQGEKSISTPIMIESADNGLTWQNIVINNLMKNSETLWLANDTV